MSMLLHRRRPPAQQAELALRVGEHVPAFVAGLADVGPAAPAASSRSSTETSALRAW
jgi:hypothetical protein